MDSSTGKIIFLNSHKAYALKVYRLPSSMSVFALQNLNKIGLIWLKKYTQTLSTISLHLYKYQSGRCFCCNKLFSDVGPRSTKIIKLATINYGKYLNNCCLVHKYCVLFI